MNLITASEFLKSKGYNHGSLSKGPKDILMILNKHGIPVEKTVPVAKGISFLVDKEKAEAAFVYEKPKSDGGQLAKTLHRQDRSLARSILAIANELGINLNNHETIIDIAEYKE